MPLRYAFEGIIITQANKNWYTRETLRLIAYRDKLKEKTDPETGKTELTPEEKKRFEVLKQAIQYTEVAESPTRTGAKELISRLVTTGLTGSMADLEAIKVRADEEEHPSCQSYYLNTKVADATKFSNSTRAANAYQRDNDKDAAKTNSVFLDEWKFWFDKKISTVKWCLGILVLITSSCLLLSTWIITRWNKKVT